jgi:hypothetical protein
VTTASDALIAIWLISASVHEPHPALYRTVRRQTIAAMETAGLITLGGEELVPEYEGGRRGLRWAPGRVGRRLVLTESGREAAGWRLPADSASGPRRAYTALLLHAGDMAADRPVVIYPPDEEGGRRVRVDGEILGVAYSVRDVARFMQEAGLQDWDEMDVVRYSLIEWRGGGPEKWGAQR